MLQEMTLLFEKVENEIKDIACPDCKKSSDIIEQGTIWMYAWCRKCKNFFPLFKL